VPDQPAMPRRTKLLIGTVFCALVIVATVAPISLMLLPNPRPVPVHDIASQQDGAFITTQGAILAVFPRADPLDQFPPDAPSVGPTPVITVKANNIDVTAGYNLYTFAGVSVPAKRATVGTNIVEMRPATPLAPGRYVAEIARDDLFGGSDYVYFSVGTTPTAPAL
jgi:hypothetical protein